MTGSSHNNGTAQGVALPEGIELGKYRLIRKIGQGGFGITYLALHTESKEQVVVKENMPTFYAYRSEKTLTIHPLDEGEAKENYLHTLQRFVDEARTLAHLHHPNIVRVLEAFEALGTAYYVMPLITGKELHKAAPAAVDEAWLAPILRTLLGALDYLHAQNLLHRDIKPGNILLQEDGTPIIIDFGTARALQSNRSATMVGTPGYTPIEQITIHGNRGPWTDLYALGATCYRVITGELPPEANERLAADEDPYRPLAKRAELRHRFSAELLQSIDTALAVRAKNRWQSAKDWLQHIPTATPQPAAEPSTRSLPVTPLATEAATPRRSKLRTALIAAGLLLLPPGLYGAYTYYQAAAQEAELRRAEEVRAEAARLLQEEAERKARAEEEARLAQEKAAAELARNTELLTRVLAELHAALLQARPLIPTAAKNVAEGQTPADQAPLQQQLNAMLTLAAQLQAPAAALTPEQRAAVCDSLPAEPQALRRYLTELCNHTSAAPSAEDILAILGWNDALSSAQEQKAAADRKAKEEAERLAKEKAEQAAKAAAERKAEKEKKLRSYATGNDVESVKKLLAEGVDVNAADEDGDTPLHWAAGEGHTEIVKLLLAAPGINVNKATEVGTTPLFLAAHDGHAECVKLLLATPGIEVNKATNEGTTPLCWAARNGHTKCVKLLLAAPGIDVNKANEYGWTPLQMAALFDHTECVKLLLAAPGIDVNKADNDGDTPLYLAAFSHTECVKLLLAAPGIDVNKADKDGSTPLYQAAYSGHTECIKLLLAAPGIDVNKAGKYGQTPLYLAADIGRTEIVKLLLAAPGIDVNKADKDGETPLYRAARDGHTKCVKLLKAAGAKK